MFYIHYRGSPWGSQTQQHTFCLHYAHSQHTESHLRKKQPQGKIPTALLFSQRIFIMLLQMLFFTAAILLCAVQTADPRSHRDQSQPELFCACAHISKLVSTGVENAILIVMRHFTVNFIFHEETPSMKKKFVSSSLRPWNGSLPAVQ